MRLLGGWGAGVVGWLGGSDLVEFGGEGEVVDWGFVLGGCGGWAGEGEVGGVSGGEGGGGGGGVVWCGDGLGGR